MKVDFTQQKVKWRFGLASSLGPNPASLTFSKLQLTKYWTKSLDVRWIEITRPEAWTHFYHPDWSKW